MRVGSWSLTNFHKLMFNLKKLHNTLIFTEVIPYIMISIQNYISLVRVYICTFVHLLHRNKYYNNFIHSGKNLKALNLVRPCHWPGYPFKFWNYSAIKASGVNRALKTFFLSGKPPPLLVAMPLKKWHVCSFPKLRCPLHAPTPHIFCVVTAGILITPLLL